MAGILPAASGPLRLAEPRMVGREQDLAQLEVALSDRSARVLVEGDPGVGKSRLLGEFLVSPAMAGRTALVANCLPFREPFTLGPVLDAIRSAASDVAGLGLSALGGAFRPFFPEWADDLPAALEPLSDPSAARHRLFRAVCELLDKLSVDVLVVDDAQWADEATLDFLLFLAAGSGVGLIAAYRPGDLRADSQLRRLAGRPETLRLRLRLLDAAGTAALMLSMLDAEQLSPAFTDFMHERTGGLPLAVAESMRLLYARDDLSRQRTGWWRRSLEQIEVPASVSDVVLEQAARLVQDARAVAEAAAVLAEPSAKDLLAVVSGLDEPAVTAGLQAALASGLLTEDGRGLVSFRHVLAGRAVYESVTGLQRREMHCRAAEALAASRPLPLARLLGHSRRAGQIEQWFGYAEQAAGRAVTAGDEATATAVLCDVIVEAGLSAESLLRAMHDLPSLTLVDMQTCREIAESLRRALAGIDTPAGSDAVEGGLRSHLARVLSRLEDYGAAWRERERALALLPGDSLEAARCLIYLGFMPDSRVPRAAALDGLRRAGATLLSAPRRDALPLSVDRVFGVLALGSDEGWEEAAALEQTWPPGEQLQLIRLHAHLGYLSLLWGRYGDAARHQSTGRELGAALHLSSSLMPMLDLHQLRLDWLTGAWAGLIKRAEVLGAHPDASAAARREADLIAGMTGLAVGENADAVRRIRRVLDEMRGQGVIEQFADAAAALARSRLAAGAAVEAVELTDEPVSLILGQEAWIWATEIAPARVDALIAAGRVGNAQDLADRFAAGLDGCSAQSARSALANIRAALLAASGDHAAAAGGLAAAAQAWRALPRPYDALLAQEQQASCLITAGQEAAGVRLLTEVFDGLAALGARADAVRVMLALRKHGIEVKRPWWGGRRSGGGILTPRELDVVRLLANGATDREIAQSLYLSPQTVASHMKAARRKLGVTSRTALAVRGLELDSAVPASDD